MSRSSTSSSDRAAPAGSGARWPIAALVALVVLVGVDRIALGTAAPWESIYERIPDRWKLERGLVHDRLELERAALERAEPDPLPIVAVVGTSRANAGYRKNVVPRYARDEFSLLRLAHATVDPFVTRTLARRLAREHPAVVVLMLSEFDTHGQLLLVPAASYGDPTAIWALAANVDRSFVFDNRVTFYRLAVAALSNGYRYRDVLGRAGLDDWRRFPLEPGAQRGGVDLGARQASALLAGDARAWVSDEDFERLRSEIQAELGARAPNAQLNQIRRILRGDHARVQQLLLEQTIEIWRAAGIDVLIVETPLNPIASPLYDTSIRQEFLDFARRMRSDQGASFLPLEKNYPFEAEQFADLTHLSREGARQMTRHATRAAVRILRAKARSVDRGIEKPLDERPGDPRAERKGQQERGAASDG